MQKFIIEFFSNKRWGQIFTDFVIVLLTTLLPTVFLLIWSGLKMHFHETLSSCYIHGEFLAYSIAFAASSFVILRTQKANYVWIALTLLILTATYSIVLIATLPIENQTPNDSNVIFWISVVFFIISMVEFFISLCKQYTVPVDAREKNMNMQKIIQNNLK